jgi:hypothetical protein
MKYIYTTATYVAHFGEIDESVRTETSAICYLCKCNLSGSEKQLIWKSGYYRIRPR